MITFHLTRSLRDPLGHLILIAVPLVLIAFFNFVFGGMVSSLDPAVQGLPYLSLITIGFALTFQIYGASISFEALGEDFFSPRRDRLASSPVEPRRLVSSILLTGTMVSFLQTLAVLVFSRYVLGADLGPWFTYLPLFLLSVVFHQFLGTVILLLAGSVKVANGVLTMYGMLVPMSMGLYFPLPEGPFFSLLRHWLSPLALANTAIRGAMEGDTQRLLISTSILGGLTLALWLGLRPLLRRIES